MANVRTFYAIQQVAIKNNASAATTAVAPTNSVHYITGPLASGLNQVTGRWEAPRGVQSVGMTTNFNLEELFELGQVEVYEQSERQPEIEIQVSKVIDGSKPFFLMASDSNQGNDIIARTQNYKSDIAFSIYPDTQFRATGKPLTVNMVSGAYISSVSYTFPIDGPVTEDITLISNDKTNFHFTAISGITAGHDRGQTVGIALSAFPLGVVPSGVFGNDGNTSALVEGGAQDVAGPPDRFGVIVVGSGVQRREEVEISRSILPRDIPGVITPILSGINAAFVNGGFGQFGPGTASASTQTIGDSNTDYISDHIQSITCSIDLGREDIFELGTKRPYARVLEFPIEVTASIEVLAAQGDLIEASSAVDCGPNSDNTIANNTIIIRTCDGLQVDLGDSNRLTSVSSGGGESGGSSMTITYEYQSFGTFNISHDRFQPNHRVLVLATGASRFNRGGTPLTRTLLGI